MSGSPDNGIAQREVLLVALYFVAHLALTLIGSSLAVGSSNAPWFWPAAGLLPTAVAVTRPRLRPLILLAAAVAERVAAGAIGSPALDPGGLMVTLANLVEAVAGAAAVSAMLPSPWYRRTSVEIFAAVCVGALIIPLIGAGVHGGLVLIEHGSSAAALATMSAWWAADVLGILLINPLMGGVLLMRTMPGTRKRRQAVGGAALLVLWIIMAYYLTAQPGALLEPISALSLLAGASFAMLGLAALCLPPLFVASLSFTLALVLNLSTRMPGTLMAQTFDAPDGPHFAARALLLAGAVCSYMISLIRFERIHAPALAERRRSPHRVIARLATRLAQCEPGNAQHRIVESLETVGKTCGADRCVIFQIDDETGTFSQSHRWCRAGVEDMQPLLQRQPMTGVSDLVRSADRTGALFLRASDIDTSSALGRYLTRADAWAVAYAPLRSDKAVTGVLGLTWQQPTRRWGTDSSVVLQSAAQVIGRTLSRTRSAHADAAYRDKLRALTARLDQLDASVRRETAADLHDGAAQALAVARLRLAQIRQHGDASSANLQSVEDMIVAALTEIRGVIRRMVPSALYDLGLAHALREFVDESREQLALDLTMHSDGQIDPMPGELASLLYRAARELITNAIKHAEAKSIALTLTRSDHEVVVMVSDDGRGFRGRRTGQRFADGTGLGLFSLRERLGRIGGTIAVYSNAGGTKIAVSVPLVSPLDGPTLTEELDDRSDERSDPKPAERA